MGGSPDVNVPGPSEEERALQREQTELLREQRDILGEQQRIQNLLSPFLFESAGAKPIINEEGEIIGFDEIEDPFAERRQDIESRLLDRTVAALEGKLPVDPGVLNALDEEESFLRERLRKQLGPGFETSSPGIEALGEFGERKQRILDAARRADLTLAEQLGLAREGSNQSRIDATLSRILGVQGSGFQGFGPAQGIASGFGSIAGRLQQDRALQTQASIARANAQAQTLSGLFGGLGSIGGAVAGAGLAPGGFLLV